MNKNIWIVITLIIVSSFIIGISTKNSFYDPEDGTPLDEYVVIPTYPFYIRDYLFEEIDRVDFIAKVTYTGERYDAYLSVKSIVHVDEVYKGNENLIGERIAVYENNYFNNIRNQYVTISYFNVMQEGRSYYVFLREKIYMKSYQDKLSYYEFYPYPVDFSILSINHDKKKFIDPTEPLFYKDISQYEFLFFSDDEYDEVIETKQKIIDKYISHN